VKWTRASVLIPAACFLLSSCTQPRYYTIPDDAHQTVRDYNSAMCHWSAQDEIHQRFISLADGYAVYLSWEVRQAFINTVRDQLNPEQHYIDQLIERNLRQFENANEFYLGLYCYEREWCRLSGIDPVWNLTLENDSGVKVRPLYVEDVDIPADQAWLFPDDMRIGRTIYRAVFPKFDNDGLPVIDEHTEYFQMKCHSLLGILEFRWILNSTQ
jgi:hypothetical protein